jgi:hypothetical protein
LPRRAVAVIAGLVVAQAFELAAHAAQPQLALLQLDLPRAQQVELRAFAAVLMRRIDPHTLRMFGVPEVERRQHASHREVSAGCTGYSEQQAKKPDLGVLECLPPTHSAQHDPNKEDQRRQHHRPRRRSIAGCPMPRF